MALRRLSELLFGFVLPLSFLQQQETRNISKQSLQLTVCVLLVKLPMAHKLGSCPLTTGACSHVSSDLSAASTEGLLLLLY